MKKKYVVTLTEEERRSVRGEILAALCDRPLVLPVRLP